MIVYPLIVLIKSPSFNVSCTQNPATFFWIIVLTNFSKFVISSQFIHVLGQYSALKRAGITGTSLNSFLKIACPTQTVSQFWIFVELAAPFSKSLTFSCPSSYVWAVGGGGQDTNLGVCFRCRRLPSRCRNHADANLLQNAIIGGIGSRCLRRIMYRTILQVWLKFQQQQQIWWRPAWRTGRRDG